MGGGPERCRACRADNGDSECDTCKTKKPQLPEPEAETLDLFLASMTQVRRALSGEALGLDYAGVDAAARWMGIKMTAGMMARLQVLELEMVSGGAPQGPDKPCRHPAACAACTKRCGQRMA